MQILLTISILVLVVLLWVTVSIVRHISRSRRRARFLRERQQPYLDISLPPSIAAEPTFAELAARVRAALPTPPIAKVTLPLAAHASTTSPQTIQAGRAVPPPTSPADPLSLIDAARGFSFDIPQPHIRPSGVRKALEASANAVPQPQPQPEVLRILEVPFDTPVPAAVPPPRKLPHSVSPPANAAAPDSALRRPVRSVHPFAVPQHRPDWAYFNKDMGDLSDPAPSRINNRARSR